jgi:uncharacterized protein (TIGR02246 family)
LACWNQRSAGDFAALFTSDGSSIGFDGSQMNGREDIQSTLRQTFDDHMTGAFVAKIREVRFLTPEVAVVRAVAGVVPHGQSDLDPALNMVQTLVAAKQGDRWRIAVHQTTPAQFHGRPELSEALTAELRELL